MRRKCIEQGCPEVQDATRCHGHQREHQRAQSLSKAKYKDPTYLKVRENVKRLRAQGITLTCSRCNKPITPSEPCDIDHLPDGSLGPSHASCNRRAGGKNSYAKQKAQGRTPYIR